MTLFKTEELTPQTKLTQSENDQVYCALDCCLTLEIFEELARTYGAASGFPQDFRGIYDFECALQGPYLEMMQRGFRVDDLGRRAAAEELNDRIERLEQTLDLFAQVVWDERVKHPKTKRVSALNARSPVQLKRFFYGALRLPEVWLSQKGERKLSVNREALEKLDQYLYARPFVNIILGIRDLAKQLEVFETGIDPDGRFRSAYNIAGTETGRPSSSKNAFGTGRNAQNIAPNLRYVFVADPRKIMCVVDLEQVEARDVGFFCGCLFDDWTFLDACESGDLHTNNAKRIWPELDWTGDRKKDRRIADKNFYREFSYRDMAKRGSHLSNYMGTAWTAARSLKLPIGVLEDFQARYCRGSRDITPAYPCIPRWWQWTAQQLQTTHQLVTPFGRRRHFFGRPGDDTTLREAIAFLPQSTTADRMNLGLWRVWHQMPECQLLAQTYDSITFQFDETLDVDATINKVLKLIEVELFAPSGRRYVVPGECKWGFNWGAQVTQEQIDKAKASGARPPKLNLGGLIKWQPGEKTKSIRQETGLRRLMA
jgi:DNA polymerase I-like protein with 3'-5' exonuclease and polymerase domains